MKQQESIGISPIQAHAFIAPLFAPLSTTEIISAFVQDSPCSLRKRGRGLTSILRLSSHSRGTAAFAEQA